MRYRFNNEFDLDTILKGLSDSTVIMFLIFVFLFFLLIFSIFYLIGKWMLFEKANQKGWKTLIPIYRNWVYTVDICKCHWIIFVLDELSLIVSMILAFIIHGAAILIPLLIRMIKNYNLAIKTHQSPTSYIWFAVFNIPVDTILGYCRNSYEYNPNEPSSEFGFFGTKQ